MRHHQFTNFPASWAGSYCCDSPWDGRAPPALLCFPPWAGRGLGFLPRDRGGKVPGHHAGVKGQQCSPDHPPSGRVCRSFLCTYVVCRQELVAMTTRETYLAWP